MSAAASGKVTAAEIKELRAVSGAPMMDCKKALEDPEVAGDLDKAFAWLREHGAIAASKKSGRVAAEGLVSVNLNDSATRAALVELNSETDFVAKNDQFQNTLAIIAQSALEAGSLTESPNGPPTGTPETLKAVNELKVAVDASSPAATAAETVVALVGKIRENLVLRRAAVLEASGSGIIVPYVHNKANDTMGSIGVVVAVASDPMPAPGSAEREALEAVGKVLALQVAATRPLAVDRTCVDAATLDRMREGFAAEAKASGKPDKVIGRIVDGKLNKFFAESCLMEQECIPVEGELTVAEAVKQASADVGADVEVQGFRVLVVGDGVDAADEDDEAARA